jgi:hypothetical protein
MKPSEGAIRRVLLAAAILAAAEFSTGCVSQPDCPDALVVKPASSIECGSGWDLARVCGADQGAACELRCVSPVPSTP